MNRTTIVAVTVRGSSFANDPTTTPRRLTKAPITRTTTLGFRTHLGFRTTLT
jgi:hypothetical protein